MINDIIKGMVAAIVAAFPNKPVYTEPVEQGIVEGSFSVRCVKPQRDLFRGKRYYEELLYEVVYFPPQNDRYNTSNETVEKLFDCLEVITLPDTTTIRGYDMKANTDEDFTVVFTVRYSDFLYKQTDDEIMKTLEEHIIPV